MRNLCVVLTDKGRKKIKKEREIKFGSQMAASWEIGIPQVNISRWERGATNPKFYSFGSYLQKLGIYKGFLKNKDYVNGTKYHGFKIKRIKSTNLTKEKAYVLGVVGPGDGYLAGDYSIGLNAIDKDFVDYFQYCLEKTFGLKCRRYIRPSQTIKQGKIHSKQYIAILCSKSAVGSLRSYGVSFKEGVWRIPMLIKNSTNGYKAMYLRGVFDSQAHARFNFIAVKIKNKEGLREVRRLLKNLEIESSIHKNEIVLQISGQKYLRLYQDKVGFTLKRKKETLKKAIKKYKQYQPSKVDIKKLIPKMIELKEQGLSYRKIASLTGIGRGAVGNNLKKMGY